MLQAENKKVYDVEIAGVPLKLVSEHSDDLVNEMLKLVNHKIQQALTLTKNNNVQTASLLAALNIAEEYILLKSKALENIEQITSRTEKVLNQLESTPDTNM